MEGNEKIWKETAPPDPKKWIEDDGDSVIQTDVGENKQDFFRRLFSSDYRTAWMEQGTKRQVYCTVVWMSCLICFNLFSILHIQTSSTSTSLPMQMTSVAVGSCSFLAAGWLRWFPHWPSHLLTEKCCNTACPTGGGHREDMWYPVGRSCCAETAGVHRMSSETLELQFQWPEDHLKETNGISSMYIPVLCTLSICFCVDLCCKYVFIIDSSQSEAGERSILCGCTMYTYLHCLFQILFSVHHDHCSVQSIRLYLYNFPGRQE